MSTIGWIVAFAIYVTGCVEVHMSRLNVSANWPARAFGVLLWPIMVPVALLTNGGSYGPRK